MNKKHLFSLLSISCVFSLGSATAEPAAYRHYTFDTVSDNATPDASSHQAHALLSGQELCEGVIGQALQFKAGSKGLALGDLGLQAPATLSFWMKTNGPQSDGRLLSQLEGAATQCGALRLADGSLTVWNAQEWSVVVNGLISTGIWQHVAVVFKADGTVTGYLNGQKRQTANSTFNFKGAKAGLGSQFLEQWGTTFVGALDDLRIYQRPLSDREIETLYPAELFSLAHAAAEIGLSPMGKLARDEYLIPVRPGKVSGAPFWNVRSHQFMYAPSFDFNELEGAKSYRFTLKASDGYQYSFNASKPDATLEPIWLKIPSGRANLKVAALDANGQVLKEVGQRGFHRAAMYNGPYNKQLMSYRASAQWGLKTLFHRNYFVAWMQPGVPPEDYRKKEDHGDVWGIPYPSKLLGATVAGAALYANSTPRPADADEAIAIGRKAADYLISLNLAAGTPLEFMPPTYAGAGAFNKYHKPFMVRKNVMMNFPCVAADAYLSLFDATKDNKYLEAAIKVADTYRKLQLPEGTWYQVVDNNTGKGAYPMYLNPVKVVRFADRLVNQYGLGAYQEMRDRAFDYVMGSTMKTFNWQAQYEDAAPMPAYRNLSPGQACEFADYLLQRSKENPEYVDMALELMRFAEGQYVSWENPKPSGCGIPVLNSPNWILPCVSEQTGYFMPVNFSSSHLIETFANAYLATGNKVYLAKSKDLANTLLVAQQNHKGDYPTYLIPHSGDGKFEDVQNTWINCTVYTIRSVMRLAEALESEKTNYSADTTIVNGTDWKDTAGNPIVAHEGEIARFGDTFYWYGSSYANNPRGKFRMTAGPVWNGVQVYSSTDLKNWTYKGVCLPRPERGFGKVGATGRSHVMYNEKTKKYVMWYRWFVAMPASFLCVATADHPEGPFTPHGPQQMGTSTGFGSDMNVFQDDDGKGYVIYCDHNARDANPANGWRYAIRIDSLSDDYLTSNRDGVVIFDKRCEAPAMVKHRGKYIAVASGVHGWAGSDTRCATADSPLGPYKKQADISEQRTWGSQVTDLLYLKESDQVMALCDQWWNPDKSDIEKSRCLFLPLDIDVKTGRVQMKYLERWSPLQPNQ
jgi:maltose/maltodextrin transport system substrate-binding protein